MEAPSTPDFSYLQDSDLLERRFSPMLFDTHNHATDDSKCIKSFKNIMTGRMVSVSSHQDDWPLLQQFHSRFPERIVPAFGVHPWHVWRPRSTDWLARLKSTLEALPQSIVGEIGLDKVAKAPSTGTVLFEEQQAVFSAVFDLACELDRPVTLHCVKAFGAIFDFFQARRTADRFPPAIIFHSFSGTKDMIQSFLKLPKVGSRFYFGFSTVININGEVPSPKLIAAIKAVPQDRLLLESDWNKINSIDTALLEAHSLIANLRGWSLEDAAAITSKNAANAIQARS